MIILDGTVDGKRHRLTTGKKADKRLLTWYERHADDEFFKLYDQKFDVVQTGSPTFKEYGSMVLEITSGNRNEFSQYDETKRFNQLCKTFGKMRSFRHKSITYHEMAARVRTGSKNDTKSAFYLQYDS